MAYVNTQTIAVTADASGDATVYSSVVTGRVVRMKYTADGTSPYDATVDFTITSERDGVTIWTESNITATKTVHPTTLTQDDVGVDATARDFIWLAKDRVSIVIAQAGNATTGSFELVVA